jgi:hypothetical protein
VKKEIAISLTAPGTEELGVTQEARKNKSPRGWDYLIFNTK